MTDPRTEEIRERMAAATPGPWEEGDGWVYAPPVYDDDPRLTPIGRAARYANVPRELAEINRVRRDCALIAHAPADLAYLLGRIQVMETDAAEYDPILTRQGDLLTGVANALNGPPPELTTWSHHDLPEKARAVMAVVDAARVLRREIHSAGRGLGYGIHDAASDLAAALDALDGA